MPSQGPNSAGTGANDSAVGTRPWTNPSNIVSSNNTYCFAASSTSGDTSNYLKATDFGFSIPSGATIDGIVVEIEKDSTDSFSSRNIKDLEVKIIKGGIIQSTNLGDLSTFWPISDTYISHGSSSNLWGTSWTDSDINSSNFGVAIRITITTDKGTVYANVDHVRITVYYTEGGGGGAAVAKSNFMILETDD